MSYILYVVSKSVFYTLSIKSPAFNLVQMAWGAGRGGGPFRPAGVLAPALGVVDASGAARALVMVRREGAGAPVVT